MVMICCSGNVFIRQSSRSAQRHALQENRHSVPRMDRLSVVICSSLALVTCDRKRQVEEQRHDGHRDLKITRALRHHYQLQFLLYSFYVKCVVFRDAKRSRFA